MVIVMLVILMATTTVIIGSFVISFAAFWKRRRDQSMETLLEPDPISMPFLFDRPNRWLAVKCSNIIKVQTALGLANPTPCSWTEGFSRLNERKLFISPPVKGWIIVVGHCLPDPNDDVDKLYHFLMKVGSQLGSVQYFSAGRALNHHAWVRLEGGRVYRAYAWAGETLWNQGDVTAAEKELEMRLYDYGETPLPFPFTARDSHAANTDKVIQLAARWSIDPMALNSLNLKASLGIAGELSLQK